MIFFVNVALLIGGIFYIKNREADKKSEEEKSQNYVPENTIQYLSEEEQNNSASDSSQTGSVDQQPATGTSQTINDQNTTSNTSSASPSAASTAKPKTKTRTS